MTMPQPMPFFSAAAEFGAGRDTPREFLERCLACLEAFEPAVGAFVCHDIAEARGAADRSVVWPRMLRQGRRRTTTDISICWRCAPAWPSSSPPTRR